MIIKELIEELNKYDPEMQVIIYVSELRSDNPEECSDSIEEDTFFICEREKEKKILLYVGRC